jgi:putative cell wall-binding protein
VTGLTNGTAYTFTVHATNDTGNGPESAPTNAVTPTASTSTTPGAPTGVTASPGDTTAAVAWSAPASNGGSAITSYVVTASPGGRTATSTGTTATVTGLSNGTAYTFTVKATNANGTGPASSASAAITVGAPGAPTGVSATAGDRRATVSWTAPASNGASISSYTVTSSPEGRTATVAGTVRSATVTGLTNGTAYTFTVKATNSRGTGPSSAASGAIRPAATDVVRRLAGVDRIATSVILSADNWTAGSASAVVLARSDGYVDALAGVPLAAAKHGPLLLTTPAAIDSSVRAEIDRVLTSGKTVYVLGGTSAISNGIVSVLESDGFNVVRYAGADRFETAVEVAERGLGNPSSQLLVTGLTFADALAAGAAAAHIGGAILLTNGDDRAAATSDYLALHGGTRYAIGGDAVEAYPTATAVAGSDRYDTAARVARRFFTSPSQVGVASGETFADALPGGAHIAARSGPLLLVTRRSLPSAARLYLDDTSASISTATVYGGTGVVSDAVLADVGDAMR